MFQDAAAEHRLERLVPEGQIGRVRGIDDVEPLGQWNVGQAGAAGLANVKGGHLKTAPLEQISHLPVAAAPIQNLAGRYLPRNIIRDADIVPNTNRLVEVNKMRQAQGLAGAGVSQQEVEIRLVEWRGFHPASSTQKTVRVFLA